VLLTAVRLTNVRNHRCFGLSLGEGITVLAGPNGAGKTSVLEAVHLALRGSSPRTSSPRELITHGESYLRVELELLDDRGERVTAALAYDRAGDRRMTRNGAPLADVLRWEQELPVRAFLPDHLQLVKGSPRRRREYADLLAGREEPAFRRISSEYEEALRQRNALLRQGRVGVDQPPWETILARQGLEVSRRRARALADFAPCFTEAYARLSGGQSMSLLYRTNVAGLDEEGYRATLSDERLSDRQRSFTRLGPHRDDLRFSLERRDLRESGSQGEQRTALLALLLAERRWAGDRGAEAPLLLLDDVMSELDRAHRRRLLTMVAEGGQALLTTTTLEYFTSEELASMEVREIDGGAGEQGRAAEQ
jgi:DNA replication and repair protein RecF